MPNPKRIKIIKSKYHTDKDIVEWLVEFAEDKHRMTLVWPSKDLGAAIGIKAVIPPKDMEKFCKDIEGKEINLIIESDIESVPSFKDMSNDQLERLNKTLDKYPFAESLDIEEEDIDSK